MTQPDPDTWRDTYRWKKRLILMFAPSPEQAALRASHAALRAHPDPIADRRLLAIPVVPDQPVEGLPAEVEHLRMDLDVPADRFTALLIGLDGTEKARTHDPIDVDAWFGRIDAMPMRQRELAERSHAGDPDE